MSELIITVTLNPAIDRTVSLDRLLVDKVNRVLHVQRDAGGKGLNVSKTIKALGGHSKAVAILGGRNGKWLEEEAESLGLDLLVVPTSGETRENIKLVDLTAKQYTDLNESGQPAEVGLEERLFSVVETATQSGDYLVLAGSALPGMEKDIFAKLSEKASSQGVKVILDIEGDYLKNALHTNPFLIKPNIDELEGLLGTKLAQTSDIVQAARALIAQGVEKVVVSRGADGLLWIDNTQVIEAKALKVEVKSTVGAGDAIVASLVKGLSEGLSPEAIVKKAVATATSVIMQSGSQTGNLSDLSELEARVSINHL